MSLVNLTCMSGVDDETPPSYVLQIDDYRILLDIGWNDTNHVHLTNHFAKWIDKIDVVLLSHSDWGHLGLLPVVVKQGLNASVYATTPTWKMGHMFMYDLYMNKVMLNPGFQQFNLDSIDTAFNNITHIQYNVPVSLKGKGQGIQITALRAGHSLGGCVWKITKDREDPIYYAIDHNNKKERHLNGFELETIKNPGVFITNSFNALYDQEKRRNRDDLLLGTIQTTLSRFGNVLIVSDTAGRSLELILMLDQMWSKTPWLCNFALVFLNNVAYNVIQFAKEQVGWMSERLQKTQETTKSNPYDLKHVRVAHTLSDLGALKTPYVVISSSCDLECGFSRELFIRMCEYQHNTVVVTNRTNSNTLARMLVDKQPKYVTVNAGAGKQTIAVNCNVTFIDFEGRSDVQSTVKGIQAMEPKTLVLVHGSEAATAAMVRMCKQVVPNTSILTPKLHESVPLTFVPDLMQVTLTDSLTSSTDTHKLRGMELSWIDSQIQLNDTTTYLCRAEQAKKRRNTLFITRLRLSEFTRTLVAKGYQAMYNQGVVVVKTQNSAVYIQRHSESKQVVVECDGISQEYYDIRDLLYQQFAIL